MKVLVPPAPVSEPVRKPAKPRSKVQSTLVEAFDAGFIPRVIASILWFGALLMLGVLGATRSPLVAGSFGGGIALGALLLKSQDLFVRRVLGLPAPGENLWARTPRAVILVLKYIVVGVVLGVLIERGWLAPPALAAGFIVGQIVIVGKVIGRFAALKMRDSSNINHVA